MSLPTNSISNISQPAHSTIFDGQFSPLRFLVVTIGGIFLAEVTAMVLILYFFNTLPYYLQTLIDASIMIVLIYPVIYFLSFRPLLIHIEKSRKADQQIREMALFPALNPGAVLQVDGTGRIRKTNPAAIQMGFYVGALLAELIPDFREFDFPTSIRDGSVQQDYATQFGDRFLQWVIHGAAELGLAFLYSTDITDRKRIEEQLVLNTTALEAAANGIIITDKSGSIVWANSAFDQMTGYSLEEVRGNNPGILKSGRNDPGFYRDLWETILAGNVWRGEITNKRKDGRLFIEDQTITPVKNLAGEIEYFIAIQQDVTEQKLIFAQLEDSNRELTALSISERRQRLLTEGLIESTMALNMSLEINLVLDHIFEQARRTIPFQAADIILIEDHKAHVARQWGFDEHLDSRRIYEKENLPIDNFPIWQAISTSQATKLIFDTRLEQQWETFPGMEWIRSYLASPMIYKGQVIGIINLGSDRENTFSKDMAKSLRAFAASAAVAIQNARLYKAEQQNRKIAEILSAANTALAQTLDLQMVMQTILDYIQFVMPFNVAFVMMSESDERFRIRAVRTTENHGLRESILNQSIDLISEPIIRSYLEKYESTYIPDSNNLPGWNPPPDLASMRSWLGVPLESMGKILGIVVVADIASNSFDKNQIELVEALVKQAVVAMQNAWLFDQVRAGRERLQQLSRRLVEIQENERKYIARELHDESGQALTSLKMGLHVIEREAAGQNVIVIKEQTANLIVLTDEIMESLHRLAANLRPASLDHLGLVDAITSLIDTAGRRSGIATRFKSLGSVQRDQFTEDIEASIYRMIQEALTNVLRHANATRVDVLLEWQNDKIVIIVEDDGIGFELEAASKSGHFGLLGIQERAEMLGGKLIIENTPHGGATLIVEIPYVHSSTYS